MKIDWNKVFEWCWRGLVFVVAIGIVIVVSTRWTRWEGRSGWQVTSDAFLQSDLTPIVAKVGGYVREVPFQDFDHVKAGRGISSRLSEQPRSADHRTITREH